MSQLGEGINGLGTLISLQLGLKIVRTIIFLCVPLPTLYSGTHIPITHFFPFVNSQSSEYNSRIVEVILQGNRGCLIFTVLYILYIVRPVEVSCTVHAAVNEHTILFIRLNHL